MVSTSKILTVSYGTFSCTLEGFDDSFDTMKAIAEYFRDLAADDRYFGAEPPTPDAEMLARIAEREIARRVEAREDHGKIHLRAQEEDGALAATGLLAPELEEPSEAVTEGLPAVEDASEPVAEDAVEETLVEEVVEETLVEPELADDAPADTEAFETDPETALDDETADEEDFVDEAPTEDSNDEPEDAVELDSVSAEKTETEEFLTEISASAEVEEEAKVEPEPSEDDASALDPYDLDPDIAAFMADAAAEEAQLAAAQSDDSVDDLLEVDEIEAEIAELEDVQDDQSIDLADVITEATEKDDAPEISDPDDIAEKLQRIRAVAAQSEPEFAAHDFSEDEHAEDLMEDTSSELEALLASTREDEESDNSPQLDLAAETLEQAFSDDEEDDAEEFDKTTDIEEVLESSDAENTHDDAKIAEPADAIEEDELAQLLADSTPDDFADREVDELEVSEVIKSEVTNFEFEEESLDAPAEDAAAIKDDLEPLVLGSEERVEIVEEETVSEDLDHDVGDSTLSPEDEADLLRELAEVEAEIETDPVMPKTDSIEDAVEVADLADDKIDLEEAEAIADSTLEIAQQREALSNADAMTTASDLDPSTEVEPEPEIEPEEPKEKPRGLKRLLGMGKNEPEQDVERIFDEADSQMEDKEASLRRNAIQHLRAAVAATRAEHKAGGKIEKDVDESPYRSDLAEVVRPRRPSTSETAGTSRRTTRPEDIDPAPLKLVAEQRVDVDQAPVRPRRVSAGERPPMGEMQTEAMGGFASFAEEMGATELPQILEAAAAYMSDVEGRAEFSRPMLMNKLKEVTSDNYSREDGLRSFGELLRGGKLRKIRGGRFAVTDETEFRSEARDAG